MFKSALISSYLGLASAAYDANADTFKVFLQRSLRNGCDLRKREYLVQGTTTMNCRWCPPSWTLSVYFPAGSMNPIAECLHFKQSDDRLDQDIAGAQADSADDRTKGQSESDRGADPNPNGIAHNMRFFPFWGEGIKDDCDSQANMIYEEQMHRCIPCNLNVRLFRPKDFTDTTQSVVDHNGVKSGCLKCPKEKAFFFVWKNKVDFMFFCDDLDHTMSKSLGITSDAAMKASSQFAERGEEKGSASDSFMRTGRV